MKSHFTFTKKQRNGIFLLIAIMLALQVGLYFFNKNLQSESDKTILNKELQQEIDSLKVVQIEVSKFKIFPYNPNYITDYKGYTLGMSNEEIDRLHRFRATNKWVNSASEFQQVTKVSDSLLAILSPNFKFPEWVTNPKSKSFKSNNFNNSKPKSFAQKIDLNTATASQLKQIYGIGEKLSDRIVSYREKIGGQFIADVELTQVYGLSPEVIERIQEQFTVKTPKSILRFNLNTATRDELVTIQFIDYEVAHSIIEQRILLDGFKSLTDLTKVKDFPVNKIEIITLYLTLE